jgi:hypothetical protein
MLISELDFIKDITLAKRLKGWTEALRISSKKEGASIFQLDGPQAHICRPRRQGQSMSTKSSFTFEGGEEFRIQDILIERKDRPHDKDVEILIIFAPASGRTIAEVATMTMPLAVAATCFVSFQDWLEQTKIEPIAHAEERKRKAQEIDKLPTVEETRSGSVWGSW